MGGISFITADQPILAVDAVTPSGSDVTISSLNVRYLRCGSAANLVLRAPGSAADVTLAVTAGEYVPVGPGTTIRSTGTTTTPIHAFSC
jgi:hypothetical protein